MQRGVAAIAAWSVFWLVALVALALTPAPTPDGAGRAAGLTIAGQHGPSPLLRGVAAERPVADYPMVEDLGSNPAHTYQ